MRNRNPKRPSGTYAHLSSVLLITALLSAGAGAADISVTKIPPKAQNERAAFHLLLSGDIEDGDLKKLQSELDRQGEIQNKGTPNEHIYLDGDVTLYLRSNGGSYAEALKIAKYISEQSIGTIVDDGASCFSACGIVFLAGRHPPEDEYSAPNRLLAPTGRLGLHAPFLEYEGDNPNRELIEKAYDLAVKNIADLIRHSAQFHIRESLLPEFLEQGRKEFLLIDTVDKLGRYRVELKLDRPKVITPEMINNYCANIYAWVKNFSSAPSDANLDDNGKIKLNDLLSFEALTSGRHPKIYYQSRLVKQQASERRTRYILPSSPGPEGTTMYCIFDVTSRNGNLDYQLIGFAEESGETLDENYQRIWSEMQEKDFERLFFSQTELAKYTSLVAFAPPDTPHSKVQDIFQTYERRSASLPPSRSMQTPSAKQTYVHPRLSIYNNFDLDGGDFNRLKEVPQDVCVNACQQESRCQAYSYDKWNRWCFLKERIGLLRFDPQSVTAVKATAPSPKRLNAELRIAKIRNRQFPGKPYAQGAVPNMESCERACLNANQCLALTFDKVRRECRLFSEAAEYMPNAQVDSGVKRQILSR